jgi:hypothetical protein
MKFLTEVSEKPTSACCKIEDNVFGCMYVVPILRFQSYSRYFDLAPEGSFKGP